MIYVDEQILRYSRQIILKDIGLEGQKKLLMSKVLVIGAGGLGSPAIYYLAACGIGTIGIVDFDVVGISNLNRQIIHSTDDLGKYKADSAEEKVKKLNPDVNILKYKTRIMPDNIEDIIKDYDVIIDASDNFPTRYLVNDACFFLDKPLIEAGAIEFEGIVMTIIPGKGPCYRCLYHEEPKNDAVAEPSDSGILGMVAGVIGSIQALEAVKIILNIGRNLSGRVLTFDALNLKFRDINWHKRDTCPLCGKNPTIKNLKYEKKL
ncbi:HesA/MoeB/ThiF family protein [Aceticella autotrophica]|uniref:HesA/MoeB/ThiF family protein n=1 Tax=Aceticella autotrophica TaxID=2755338 RepID=A0A975AUU0_9THEO|nr:HesA/MoeB/ThiF family protein [Aceticella autotrophica]QSZ26865.1 HesA/MoeB/ThiF family protein [Aceticella autotrophica]